MTLTDTSHAVIISDEYRTPVTVRLRESGGVLIRSAKSFIALSPAELTRLMDVAQPGRIERFPVGNV